MSQAKEVKQDRKYTKDHEWALTEGGELVVGITAFAVDALGDITLVSIDVKPGDRVEANKAFGTIESVKTLSDLFAPVSGEVIETNGSLKDHPDHVNSKPHDTWMVKVKMANSGELASLLDAGAYEQLIQK